MSSGLPSSGLPPSSWPSSSWPSPSGRHPGWIVRWWVAGCWWSQPTSKMSGTKLADLAPPCILCSQLCQTLQRRCGYYPDSGFPVVSLDSPWGEVEGLESIAPAWCEVHRPIIWVWWVSMVLASGEIGLYRAGRRCLNLAQTCLGQRYPESGPPCVATSCAQCQWRSASGLSWVGPVWTAANSLHPVDEPPLASGIHGGVLNWFMCLLNYYYWIIFHRLWFSFPLVMYQGLLFESFGRYFVVVWLGFLPVMYLGAVYPWFGWYCVFCIVSFTCLLSFVYHHVDFHTLCVYHISSIWILSCCYPTFRVSLPVACEGYPVAIRVWRSRSSSSTWLDVLEIWINILVKWDQI